MVCAIKFTAAMVGGIPHRVCKDCCEGVDPELILGDFHEDWEERFPDHCEVIVRGLSIEGGKGLTRLPEEERDRFGHHERLGRFSRDQVGSVDDCNDYDEGKGVGSSKLVELGAFGDTTEPVRSCDGYSSHHSFFGVKFELDFHCRAAMGGTKDINTKYEEEQY